MKGNECRGLSQRNRVSKYREIHLHAAESVHPKHVLQQHVHQY